MNSNRLVMAAFAAMAAASALAQTAPAARQIADRLTANGLKADVSFLASDALQGRATPSPGLDIAGEFIADNFRRAGLEPAGDDGGYFQTASYLSLMPNTDGLEVTLDIGGQKLVVDRDSIAFRLPAAARFENVPAIRVRSAPEMAGLTPGEKRGKVVLAEGVDGWFALSDRPAMVISVIARPAAWMEQPSPVLCPASDPRTPMVFLWDPAVRKVLAKSKGAAVSVTARIPEPAVTPAKLRNVIGIFRGSDPSLKNTYVLLTAHYDHIGVQGTGKGDHIFNGANDDASGTASVIEISKALASLGVRPKRSIVFMAFFGEELGMLGSRYYVEHPVFPLAKTIADLNLEQLGRTDVDGGWRVSQLNATGFDFSSLTAVLREAGKETGVWVAKDVSRSDPFFARADNQAFADAGVPSHTLSVGYMFPDYHRAGDEWPKLSYDNMAKVDRTIALAVYRVADAVEAPRWNTANPKTARYVHAREAGSPGAGSQ